MVDAAADDGDHAGLEACRKRPAAEHRVEVTAGGLFKEYSAIEINADGTATATVGTSAHGQGHETSFSMIVQELLGIPMDQVTIVQSDTGRVPRGQGTMGSRRVIRLNIKPNSSKNCLCDECRHMAYLIAGITIHRPNDL